MADLPEPLPSANATPVQLAAWATKATRHEIEASWRPGHSRDDGLVVRLADRSEIVFESVAEACRPDTFFAAFLARDGISMPEYSKPQVRVIVGALVRMAEVSDELDDRDHWGMIGEAFLRASLTSGNVHTIERVEPNSEHERLTFYREAIRLAALLGNAGEDTIPPCWHAKDVDAVLVARGGFLAFARRREYRVAAKTVIMQMRRLAWDKVELRPSKPGDWQDAPRPHLRLWRIANGWDGLWIHDGTLAEDPEDLEGHCPAVPPWSPKGTHARTRGGKRDSAGQRDSDSADHGTGS